MNRHCGLCHEKTNKEYCWRCEQRIERTRRLIASKLIVIADKAISK